jgi:DNA-binding MarR family transcriptional regulator
LPALIDDLAGRGFTAFHARLRDEGHPSIRPGHGCVFRFIHEGGSRLTELAESSGLSKQAVGEVVDDLEKLGYAERVQDPDDRRAKLIRLTKKGTDAQQRAIGIFAEIEREWAERYGAERVAQMRELLEEMAAA